MASPYVMRSIPKGFLAIIIITAGSYFFTGGIFDEGLANIFQEGYKIQSDFVPNNNIPFQQDYPNISNVTYYKIYKTDDHPLTAGQPLSIHVYLSTNELPKELVVHIFHQDMIPFFTGVSPADYRGMTSKMDKVLHLRYGDIYNVQFNLTTPKNGDHYDLNGNSTIEFTTPGTYMAQISEKTNDGNIEHYMTPYSVTTIRDPQVDWTVQAMQNLIHVAEQQKSTNIRAFGMSYVAIGIGMMLSGLNILFSTVEKRKKETNTINDESISIKENSKPTETQNISKQPFDLSNRYTIISKKYGRMILTNFGLTIWFVSASVIVGIIFSLMWNDFDTNLTKLGTIAAVSGIFLASYMTLWIMNRDRIKSIEENAVYKVSLLHDLSGLTHTIIQPLLSEKSRRRKDVEETSPKVDEQKLFEAQIEEFKYWAGRIQATNSNPYVSPVLRDAVNMLLHQGIKPIAYPDLGLTRNFLNDTFLRYLDRIIFSQYMSHDKDPSVQHFLNQVKKTRSLLLKIVPDEAESSE